ncbi:hypothetical protein VitviT2T_020163 [Vitis vinifera]|uniref:Reverse transcriptase domain-containing protein n=1 Tax=Vitis vinifera TaxID=29760 RepID=A0ABY9D3L3_VITVI|nr:hypothetical protein VitviT2T_020163 [Vitis vinifera]
MDIEKAFDHVNWNFLMEVMSKMGFGHRWINWIKWCCSTASFSLLINGSPSSFFRSSRGLRQGNPLSPYLFLLAMEALSQLLSRARNGNFISGFRVGGRGSEGLFVSHLLFADDTLIFCDADADQLQYLSWTFMWFEAISGLKVNLNKTEAIPVGEGIPMETLAAVLGCKIGSLPTSYLGLPLGAPYKSIRVWDAVEERFRKRLSLWKKQYLSKGGCLTLLKSTLSSLPTYFLSLFVIPKRVCARLEKIQRDFLWGGGALENKPHLVSWKVVCADKKKGGLGIRSLATLNKALLGKWLWRFANENEPLWKQIILSKYDLQEGGWCSKDARNRYGVGVWKAIRKGWENFRSHSRFIIGDGTRVKFWKDLWCGNQSLEEAFPILFNLSVNKEGWVQKRRELLAAELNGYLLQRANVISTKVVDHVMEKLHAIMGKGTLDCKIVSQHMAFSIMGATLFGDAFLAWSKASVYEELLMMIAKDACFWASYGVTPFWKQGFWRYQRLCMKLKSLTQDGIEQCRQNYKLFSHMDKNSNSEISNPETKNAPEAPFSSGILMPDNLSSQECNGHVNAREEPCGNIMRVMFHGCLTTAGLIGNILARLATHPEIQDKIYSEIIMSRKGAQKQKQQNVDKMLVLLATVYESARLMPAGPLLQRCSLKHGMKLLASSVSTIHFLSRVFCGY